MENEYPIKAHLNEEMRAEIEFSLRRTLSELREMWIQFKANRVSIQTELNLIEKCLKEIVEAGT